MNKNYNIRSVSPKIAYEVMTTLFDFCQSYGVPGFISKWNETQSDDWKQNYDELWGSVEGSHGKRVLLYKWQIVWDQKGRISPMSHVIPVSHRHYADPRLALKKALEMVPKNLRFELMDDLFDDSGADIRGFEYSWCSRENWYSMKYEK